MEDLARSKASCNLRKIDIDTWSSAVARQHGIRRLPTVWLYDGVRRVSEDAGDVFRRVQALDGGR